MITDRGRASPLAVLLVTTGLGDRRAFALLFDVTAPTLLAMAAARVPDEGRRTAAVERTYLDIWRQAAIYDPAQPAAAWILERFERTLDPAGPQTGPTPVRPGN